MTIYSVGGNLIGKSVQLIFACLLAIPLLAAPQDTYAQKAIGLSTSWTQTRITANGSVLPAAGGPSIEVWYTDQNDSIAFGAYGNPTATDQYLGQRKRS